MIEFDYELELGFILPLREIRECFTAVGHGEHEWTLNAKFQTVDQRRYADIKYSNPGSGDLPNSIHYLFPIVEDGGAEPMVCLHPSAAIPLVSGLYFEGPDLKHDILEDWNQFWSPLRTALHARLESR